MATKQYKVEQEVELISTTKSAHRWGVRIIISENDENTDPVVEASGRGKSKSEAVERMRKFTKWALKEHDLFGFEYGDDDDDDEDE